MTMRPITILLADDHTIVRDGLRALLNLEKDMQVVGEAANGHQAVAFASKLVPDIVVMDLAMPLLNGLDAIARIRECTPASTKILVLSSYDEAAYVQQAKALGASGYLVKKSDSQVLARAIREIHQGHDFFKPIQHAAVQIP
jgi:DNA-binding NarL/FixJ family response regulator